MTEEETITKLSTELAMFVHDEVAAFIAKSLFAYDLEAREIVGVKFRANRAHVINYLDEWDNNLTFVIKLTA